MTALNKQLRKAFEDNFEELSTTTTSSLTPDFSMWGKSYVNKWKIRTMTMFLNDLNDLVQGMSEKHESDVEALRREVKSLESELSDMKEAKQ